MPFFFILSGLIFKVNKEETIKSFIKRKARAIFPPLLLFGLIEIAFQMLFGELIDKLSVKYIMRSILLMNGGLFSKYWFLPALFVAETNLFLVFKLLDNDKYKMFAVLVISLGGDALSYLLNYHMSLYFESGVFATLFIYSGFIFKKVVLPKEAKRKICIIGSFIFTVTNILMLSCYDITDDVFSMTYRNPVVFLIIAFSGSIVLLILCSTQNSKSFFTEVGKQTLYIYGFHYCIFSILRGIELKVLHVQHYLPDFLLMLVEIIVTLLLTYTCAEMWQYVCKEFKIWSKNKVVPDQALKPETIKKQG